MKIKVSIFLIFMFCVFGRNAEVMAEEVKPVITSGTHDVSSLTDRDYKSGVTFKAGETVTVRAGDERSIRGIYIIWDSPVSEYTITTDNGDIVCGKNGFIHDYVDLRTDTQTVTINIPADSMRIACIRIFDKEGELPKDVQLWRAPDEKCDIMLVAAHADDEILFFGGIIPAYAITREARIQVVYMTEFWGTNKIREHEKLDGLWTSGLDIYPVCGNFKDLYSDNIEKAMKQYKLDDMVNYLTGEIRRFSPQVIVTHDENGEYGHGFHRLTSKAVTMAVGAAADDTAHAPSYESYGVWDTPKTYLHLYNENRIKLNLREPIEGMDGRNAVEIAADAYKMHVSQQWCWFYVSDDYEYSCADFGLYRTNVGADTENDIMCNLKTYKVQREEKERESISIAESIEQESREEESRRERESIEEASREAESISLRESGEEVSRKMQLKAAEAKNAKKKRIVVAVIIITAVSGGIVILLVRKK